MGICQRRRSLTSALAAVTLAMVVLPSVASGSFSTREGYRTGGGSSDVATADLDGDGKRDLAVANFYSDDVTVRLGKRDGTFRPRTNFEAGDGASGIAVGDFNRDGDRDLAVTNSDPDASGGEPEGVSILIGRGDGRFRSPVQYAAGNTPEAVDVGDFDDDRKQDLAVGNFGNTGAPSGVSILRGRSDGTFRPAVTHEEAGPIFSLKVSDLDRDGDDDIAAAIPSPTGVTILRGRGDGDFKQPVDYWTGAPAYDLAVGDLDEDGTRDLAVATRNNSKPHDSLAVLIGRDDARFKDPDTSGDRGANGVALADFDRDGHEDVVLSGDSCCVSVRDGRGDGTFKHANDYGAGSDPVGVEAAKFGQDNLPDIAVPNFDSPGEASVLLNTSP